MREKLLEGGSKQKNWVEGKHWGCQRVALRKRDPVEGGGPLSQHPLLKDPIFGPLFLMRLTEAPTGQSRSSESTI